MATTIQIRRGTKAALDGISLLSGELGYTTDTNEVYVGDGTNNYLVGRAIVDSLGNRPDAGVSGRIFYAEELSATYVDDGVEWVPISSQTEIDETTIDHDNLLNYSPNEHINHENVSINTTLPLSGGGDLTSTRDVELLYDSTDLGVNVSNELYIKDSGIDHDSLTNTHQDVSIGASPEFGYVTLNNSPVDGSHATTKDYVDNVVSGLDWKDSVTDFANFTTSEPVAPDSGDRYINTADGISSSTSQAVSADYIYEWNGADWTEIPVESGTAVWVVNEDVQYVYDGSIWVKISSIQQHNNLSNLQGGAASEYYHLNAVSYGHLSNQDQGVETTDAPTFDDLTISNPSNIYNLSHNSFADYVPDEHIDWTVDQGATNINIGNISETAITQHESAIDHDNLLNFVPNEHIDHSSVSINTGNGLIGGGDLTSSRTINLERDTTTGDTVAPLNITANGVGILIDNVSLTHSAGEISVDLVDGGSFV